MSTGAADLSALSVLVVEDNRHMRQLIRLMLRGFGIVDSREVPDSEQAMGWLRLEIPDIIIVDHDLAPDDGLAFVRTLRSDPDSPCPMVPVIMMTGHATRDMVTRARDAGVNEFLAKPVAPKALAVRLWSVITRPRPFIRAGGYFGPCRRRHQPGDWPNHGRRSDDNELITELSTEAAA